VYRRTRVIRLVGILGALLATGWIASPTVLGQGAPSISFADPQDGVTVAGPKVEIVVTVDGVELVPAGGQLSPDEGHAHVLIDRDEPKPRDFLATDDPNVVHFGAPPLSARPIELGEGQHTLLAVLGDSEHLVIEGQDTARITINVAPGFRGKSRLSQGCADIASGRGEVRLTFPEQGGALQGAVTANCTYATRDGACTWMDMAYSRVKGSYDGASGVFSGRTSGITQRRLQRGPRDECGPDRESDRPPSEIRGGVTEDGTVEGTVGTATFAMKDDQSIVMPGALEPLTDTEDAGNSEGSGSNKTVAIASFVLAALLVAFAVWWMRRGRATAET
jgi:hypothetical protein